MWFCVKENHHLTASDQLWPCAQRKRGIIILKAMNLYHCSGLAPGGVAEASSDSEAETSLCVCVRDKEGKC